MNTPKIEIPTPDPTRLTTEQLDKGLLGLREILETRIHCLEDDIGHHQQLIDQRGKIIASEVGHLQKLLEEKFGKTELQFRLIGEQRIEQKSDTKAAVEAALAAQKEAVKEQTLSSERAIAKSETATTKLIDSLNGLLNSTNKATDDKINDLKGAIALINTTLAAINGRGGGMKEGWGFIVGGFGVIVAIVAALSFALQFLKH